MANTPNKTKMTTVVGKVVAGSLKTEGDVTEVSIARGTGTFTVKGYKDKGPALNDYINGLGEGQDAIIRGSLLGNQTNGFHVGAHILGPQDLTLKVVEAHGYANEGKQPFTRVRAAFVGAEGGHHFVDIKAFGDAAASYAALEKGDMVKVHGYRDEQIRMKDGAPVMDENDRKIRDSIVVALAPAVVLEKAVEKKADAKAEAPAAEEDSGLPEPRP